MNADQVAEVLDRPYSRELLAGAPGQLAYTAPDGGPRVVPIGFLWQAPVIVIGTIPGSAKVAALRADPRCAFSIDTLKPLRNLLVRGTASIEVVPGVPDEYLEASHKAVADEDWDEWEAGVRGLYDEMALIRITPTWARLIDFETTLPSDVERLQREKSGG